MVTLIARKAFTYARRALRVGDRFAAHEGDVRILLAIGHARWPDAPSAPPTTAPRQPVMPPAEHPLADDDPNGHGEADDENDDDEQSPLPVEDVVKERRRRTRTPRKVGR